MALVISKVKKKKKKKIPLLIFVYSIYSIYILICLRYRELWITEYGQLGYNEVIDTIKKKNWGEFVQ